MSKPINRHLGDRSEFLGRYILSFLGYTVMVERQDDHFGIDIILKLTSDKGRNMYLDGGEAAFQIKSNLTPIEVDSEDRVTALYDMQQPIFLGVINRKDKKISIYSLLNRFHVYWNNFRCYTSIEFCDPDYFSDADWEKKSIKQIFSKVKVGKPICEYDFYMLEGEMAYETKNNILTVLNSWIKLERDAILWKARGLPLAPYVDKYQTNLPVPENPSLFNFAENNDIRTLTGSAKASLDVLRVSIELGNFYGAGVDDEFIKSLWSMRLKLVEIEDALKAKDIGKEQVYVDECYFSYRSSDPRLDYYNEIKLKT